MQDIIYWLGFSALASCTLSSLCTWMIYFLYNKYQRFDEKTGDSRPIHAGFLERVFFFMWLLIFISMAADFKFWGPFND